MNNYTKHINLVLLISMVVSSPLPAATAIHSMVCLGQNGQVDIHSDSSGCSTESKTEPHCCKCHSCNKSHTPDKKDYSVGTQQKHTHTENHFHLPLPREKQTSGSCVQTVRIMDIDSLTVSVKWGQQYQAQCFFHAQPSRPIDPGGWLSTTILQI